MPTLTFQQLAAMVDGEVVQQPDLITSSVVIDSREVKPDSVFFAIQGERLDGHQFLAQALATARGAVVSRVPDAIAHDKGIVRVADTTVALQRLATAIRERFPFTLIGVTGSAGKTTTKEMIATLIATERRTWKSWGNFNNLIGAPLCLDNTPDDAEVVVSEMGMNHKGEIAQIAGWTCPNIGVYTNIRPVHLEFFGTIEKIAEAKRELLENVAAGGSIVINADDPQVVRISRGFEGRIVSYGVDANADYRATDIRARGLLGTTFTLHAEDTTRMLELSLPGRHNLENLLAAIATARAIGISWEGIERGVRDVKPAYHRGVVIPWRGATIYDDSYNSNPYALSRALELLHQADVRGRRIAVIGDMLELGPDELTFHHDAGKAVPKSVDVIVGVGKRAQSLIDGAREAGIANLHYFDTAQQAGEFLKTFIHDGDLVLIKGSRGVGLDRIVKMLEDDAQ
ncbi:MAG TPA: UDP-N-acetylmuramoyl-tripeptide--D-alanyl-D-alanine ligase [Thermoanaerobaculia bacterium]|nr:UDP-N-acetylmuramoyl-tripeptide--D-alanyl-D-alanine ligase [Thermoanaerobaculia bacterium]